MIYDNIVSGKASYKPGLCGRLTTLLTTHPRTKGQRPPSARAERLRKEAVC
jgi:hypothetical protein